MKNQSDGIKIFLLGLLFVGMCGLFSYGFYLLFLTAPQEKKNETSEVVTPTVKITQSTTPIIQNTLKADSIVAKVGDEDIYYGDVLKYSQITGKDVVYNSDEYKSAMSILVEQSITLQGGSADRMVTLTANIYKSQNKDLEKRGQVAYQIRNSIEGSGTTIEGYYLKIYYGTKAEDKQYAQGLIQDIRSQSAKNTINLSAVEERVGYDNRLLNINQNNSYAIIPIDQQITKKLFDGIPDTVDSSLKSGNLPIVSEVGTSNDAYGEFYFFVRIDRKTESKKLANSFGDWLIAKSKIYKTIYY